MRSERAICVSAGAFLLVMFAVGMLVPLHSANVMDMGNRFAAPSAAQIMGTDAYGRDVFIRFLAGSRYTIMTGFMTTILAGVVGHFLGRKSRAKPTKIGRAVTVLAFICFYLPSIFLAPRWKYRLLTTVLCVTIILPLVLITLFICAYTGVNGQATTLVIGPLWGIGIAYVFRRTYSPRAVPAVTASVFAWAVFHHGVLDVLGTGVQQPETSWGSILSAPTTTWWPQAAALFCFSVVGVFAFTLSDIMARRVSTRRR